MTDIARDFHDATKYTVLNEGQPDEDILMGTPPNLKPTIGEQSPSNEPHPFKLYTELNALTLPTEFPAFTMPVLDAIAASGEGTGASAMPDRAAIARICLLSNGILKRGSHGTGRVIEYRAAGGTGARYHLELYVVCGDLTDLDAGVYHYSASDQSLRCLRSGDYRAVLVEATGSEPAVAMAPAAIVATSTFWRNAWRYQERAYRHVFWDLGTVLANVLAVAASSELPAKVMMGFDDGMVNRLLDVDGEREATVCLVPIGRTEVSQETPELPPLHHATRPVSASELDFPAIQEMHAASSLASGDAVAQWRSNRVATGPQTKRGDGIALRPFETTSLPNMAADEAIRRRRSTRSYDIEAAIPFDVVSTMLDRSNRPMSADFLDSGAGPLIDQYLIINNVADLEAGRYVVHAHERSIERLAAGEFRSEATRLACGQDYAGEGHVNIYYLADLERLLDAYGNRGYRIAQLEGALRAGKLHLAAHALGLGAVGSTSVDDEVTRFFSPHATGKSFMFVLVFGQRRTIRR